MRQKERKKCYFKTQVVLGVEIRHFCWGAFCDEGGGVGGGGEGRGKG